MTPWKFTDATNRVVSRTLDDGRFESCFVEAIQEWIDNGNTPEPADPAPAIALTDPVAKLQAFLAANPDVLEILK